MKKLIILIASTILLSLSTNQLNAQIQIGIKQGVNFSNLNYTLSEQSAALYEQFDNLGSAGFHIGTSLNVRFTEQLGLQAELLFSQQGGRFDVVEIVTIGFLNYQVVYELQRRLNYLNIPLLAKYQFLSGFNLEGGFGLGFLLSGRDSYNTETNISQLFFNAPQLNEFIGIRDQESTQFHKGVELYFALGAGYQLPSGLSFGLRYMTGLTNSLDTSTTIYEQGESITNSFFQFSVEFPLYGN